MYLFAESSGCGSFGFIIFIAHHGAGHQAVLQVAQGQ